MDGRGENTAPRQERQWWEVPRPLRARARDIARTLRKNPTPSESLLWESLRGAKLDGRSFRRQQPIGRDIVDFYCPMERLVVEVDGGIHIGREAEDAERQALLESLDLRFVRISHEQVILDLQGAVARIRAAFGSGSPLPHPSPRVGEGPGVGAPPSADHHASPSAVREAAR